MDTMGIAMFVSSGSKVSPAFLPLLLGLIVLQYVLAIVMLTLLAKCEYPTKTYVIWNLIVLLVFYVGSAAFLIYFLCTKKKRMQLKQEEEAAKTIPQPIIMDAPIYEPEQHAAAEKNSEVQQTDESTQEK